MKLPRALIVDDEKDNLDALKRLLRKDVETITAESGEEAIEVFSKGRDWDVIVSDQRMPGMSGSLLFEKLQAIDSLPTRILLTGFADIDAVIEAVNHGHIWKYIAKPWEPEDFKVTIRQGVERTQLRRSLNESRRELERALTELRARDWSRERLLQILLHEFRTAPQVLSAIAELESSPSESPTRLRFLENLKLRFARMEGEIEGLLAEERRILVLPRETFLLSELLNEMKGKNDFALSNSVPADEEKNVRSHRKTLAEILWHFFKLLSRNSGKAKVQVVLDHHRDDLFIAFKIDSLNGEILLPESLAKSKIPAETAWPALLEPFVGVDDFLNHSEGLRLETARLTRTFAALGGKIEFVFSGKGASKASKVECVLAIKAHQ
jgi:CheY-like chemotaxis protein